MNHQGTKKIQTERLTLRMLEIQDAESLFQMGCLGTTELEAENIVRDMMKYYIDKDNYNWGIEYNGMIIGRIKDLNISNTECSSGTEINYYATRQSIFEDIISLNK